MIGRLLIKTSCDCWPVSGLTLKTGLCLLLNFANLPVIGPNFQNLPVIGPSFENWAVIGPTFESWPVIGPNFENWPVIGPTFENWLVIGPWACLGECVSLLPSWCPDSRRWKPVQEQQHNKYNNLKKTSFYALITPDCTYTF